MSGAISICTPVSHKSYTAGDSAVTQSERIGVPLGKRVRVLVQPDPEQEWTHIWVGPAKGGHAAPPRTITELREVALKFGRGLHAEVDFDGLRRRPTDYVIVMCRAATASADVTVRVVVMHMDIPPDRTPPDSPCDRDC